MLTVLWVRGSGRDELGISSVILLGLLGWLGRQDGSLFLSGVSELCGLPRSPRAVLFSRASPCSLGFLTAWGQRLVAIVLETQGAGARALMTSYDSFDYADQISP